MVECKYCKRQFNSKISLGIHKKSCKGWQNELNIENKNEYKCECGKIFNSRGSLNSHARFCEKYIKKPKKVSKYLKNGKYVCECGKTWNSFQSFNAHLSHCDIHHNAICTTRKLRPSELNHSMCWENKSKDEIKEIHKKSAQTNSQRHKKGINSCIWKGKHLPEEMKEKQRIGAIKYIEKTKGKCRPRYSIKACEYINKLNEEKHWNLQHAENGGEFFIAGYFVDGYDNKLNIVFEYDEPKHYENINKNILKEKDINRQNYIIEKLHCEFWRYNEKLDILYKVN